MKRGKVIPVMVTQLVKVSCVLSLVSNNILNLRGVITHIIS